MSSAYSDHFDTEDVGGVTLVTTTTELIRHPPQAQEFSEDLARLVNHEMRTKIVINMSKTRYLGSSAFAALIGLSKLVNSKGGKLALCELDPDVMVGANILGLGTIMPIYEAEKEALEAVAS